MCVCDIRSGFDGLGGGSGAFCIDLYKTCYHDNTLHANPHVLLVDVTGTASNGC